MQVFRRMQTLVGLMCWLAEKKTRSPFRRAVGEVGQHAEAEQVGGVRRARGRRRREPRAGGDLVGDGAARDHEGVSGRVQLASYLLERSGVSVGNLSNLPTPVIPSAARDLVRGSVCRIPRLGMTGGQKSPPIASRLAALAEGTPEAQTPRQTSAGVWLFGSRRARGAAGMNKALNLSTAFHWLEAGVWLGKKALGVLIWPTNALILIPTQGLGAPQWQRNRTIPGTRSAGSSIIVVEKGLVNAVHRPGVAGGHGQGTRPS